MLYVLMSEFVMVIWVQNQTKSLLFSIANLLTKTKDGSSASVLQEKLLLPLIDAELGFHWGLRKCSASQCPVCHLTDNLPHFII